MRAWTSWTAFLAWTVAGGLLALSALSILSIGVFVLPLAVVALVLVGRRASRWPEGMRVLAGTGVLCFVVAFLSRDYSPCPESGVLTIPAGATSVECGGRDPLPWLVVGSVILGASVGAHAFLRRRREALPTT